MARMSAEAFNQVVRPKLEEQQIVVQPDAIPFVEPALETPEPTGVQISDFADLYREEAPIVETERTTDLSQLLATGVEVGAFHAKSALAFMRRHKVATIAAPALAGMVFGLIAPTQATGSEQTTTAKPPQKTTAPSPTPTNDGASINVPKASYAAIPAAWKACETPRAKLIANADVALNVPIKLTDGKEAVVYLANGARPHVKYSGEVAVGACLKANIDPKLFVVKDGVVTIPRSAFTTTSLFPEVNAKGSAATEKVDGYDKTGALKANTKQKVSAAEAQRINNLMMVGGAKNTEYRTYADYIVRDGLLSLLTSQYGAAISSRLDAAILADIVAKDGKKLTYTLTGTYDGLNVYYQATLPKDFKPRTDIQAAGPVSGAATIVNIKKS